MRLLNSVSKVIAEKYVGVPVHIRQVPSEFRRGCFYLSRVTSSNSLVNYGVYKDSPTFQIIYFGELDEARQVDTEQLYTVEGELKALFLLRRAVPVITGEGEQQRYAKIENYTSDVREDEGAIYIKITLSFTEDNPNAPSSTIGDIAQDAEVIIEKRGD
jgi:hypothetical protein